MYQTTTANGAVSNPTSGSARLNLFFKAVRSLASDTRLLAELLTASWKEEPLDTLKIIFQTRDCRGGKGEKKLFAESIIWLSIHHPATLAKNIEHIPYFGMWKDLLILMPTPFGDEALLLFAKQLREDLNKVKNAKKDPKDEQENTPTNMDTTKTEASSSTDAEAESSSEPSNKRAKNKASLPFISLAAKWAPSENHGNDKKTGSALKLALLLTDDPKNALRDYRKNYLTPLRAHLKIIETFVCAQRWNEIPYSLVPSRCMSLHKAEFDKYDKVRFAAYLKAVEEGKTTIKAKQMLPHELVQKYLNSTELDQVVELQWKAIAEETRKLGTLDGSIVLSDVSGSMAGDPMLVSIALGLLISEITAPPFRNVVITFDTNPTFHTVKGATLLERVKNLSAAPWGGSTNFQAVFNLILDRARDNRVPPEDMPKKLFVISDMQFDVADSSYSSNYQVIKRRYTEAGYTVPQIIFWNVNGNRMEFPVERDDVGVAMVSGFSPAILKSLIKMGEFATPIDVFRSIMDNPRYDILKV